MKSSLLRKSCPSAAEYDPDPVVREWDCMEKILNGPRTPTMILKSEILIVIFIVINPENRIHFIFNRLFMIS